MTIMSDQYKDIAQVITSEFGNAATIFMDMATMPTKINALSTLLLKRTSY